MALARLHLTHLADETSLEVYYCHITPQGEVLGFRRRRVPRGTAVFAFADGTPAALQACGNPTRALVLAEPPTRTPAKTISLVSDASVGSAPSEQPHVAVVSPEPTTALPEVAFGSSEFHGLDDFQQVETAELYIPQQPALPAARLASYSADNLYEWVRHTPRRQNYTGAGISLAGASILGFALPGGGSGDFPLPHSAGAIDSLGRVPTDAVTSVILAGGNPLGSLGSNGPAPFPGIGGTSVTVAVTPEPGSSLFALAIGASYTGIFLRRRTLNRKQTL